MRTALSLCLASLLATSVAAQQPIPTPAPAPAFMKKIYSPEFIMTHQAQLALTDEQKTTMRKEIANAQGGVADLQWRLAEEAEKLDKLMSQPVIDESAVMAELQEITKWEYGVKQVQLRMLIRMRNALQPRQRAVLDSLRTAGGASEF